MTKREALDRMCRFDGWQQMTILRFFLYLGESYLDEPAVIVGSPLGCAMLSYRINVLGEYD